MKTFDSYEDVQGIARFSHAHLTEASYWLLRLKSPSAARGWLATAPITSAVKVQPPGRSALQVAFTAHGLQALGLPEALLSQFGPPFLTGITESNRSRRLGDVAVNAPDGWAWGVGEREPDLVAMMFAEPGGLADWESRVMGTLAQDAFEVIEKLGTSDLGGLEPFGFADGLSQPAIDWDREYPKHGDQLSYSNVMALGEVLLGYPNEYGDYTPRPLVDASDPLAVSLPLAEEEPSMHDLGRNGSYVVLRQLEQDVRAFWHSAYKDAASVGVKPQELAEAMVGRRMDGRPMLPKPATPITDPGDDPTAPSNQFVYIEAQDGVAVPLGAHIRRANPRNADYPAGSGGLVMRVLTLLGLKSAGDRADAISSTRFHRLLRRGREYGPKLTPEDALQPAPADDPSRGLQFICLNANLARQFEFVQGAWVTGAAFDGTHGEADPLLADRLPGPTGAATNGFSVPSADAVPRRVAGMANFVRVRGGAYFFMPGLSALSYIVRKSAGEEVVAKADT